MSVPQNSTFAVSIDTLFPYDGFSIAETIDQMREDIRDGTLLDAQSVDLVCVDEVDSSLSNDQLTHQYRTEEEASRDTSALATDNYDERYETEQTVALAIDNLYAIDAESSDEACAIFRDKLASGGVLDPTEILIVPVDVWDA